MPFYRINGMIGGSSFLPSTIQPGFSETSSKTNNREEKEIISVNVNDDTETVDLFFEDVSKMLENKGIDIDKSRDKYTLFDDAIIEEDGF